MGFQFTPFIITPDELAKAIEQFTLFISNKHVPIAYISTPSEIFIDNYKKLYARLCNGEKIDHRAHNGIFDYFSITTDINSIQFGRKHIYRDQEYKSYLGSTRGFAPYFLPFTFSAYEENSKIFVTTRGSWMVDYTDIMGFQLAYPKLTKSEAAEYNITSEQDWESYSDYKLFKDCVTNHTTAFLFAMNGIEKKTQIRVSPKAKEKLPSFYIIKKLGIEVI